MKPSRPRRSSVWNLRPGRIRRSSLEHKDETELEESDFTENGGCCRNRKICWWDPPKDGLSTDFCSNTSLHGLRYIGEQKRHISERIFWFLAFVTSLSGAVYLISDVWRKYQESPIIVSFEPTETSVDEVPFPAVTVCNMNKILKSKAEKIVMEANTSIDKNNLTSAQKNYYYLKNICSSAESFLKRIEYVKSLNINKDIIEAVAAELKADNAERENGTSPKGTNDDVKQFLKDNSQRCRDMIYKCSWNNKFENCTHLFRPIETDFGRCCTFNMVPASLLQLNGNDSDRSNATENDLWEKAGLSWVGPSGSPILEERPKRQHQAGKSFGLSFLLYPNLKEYYCATSDSVGFRLLTHLSTENPNVVDFGIGLMTDSEIFVNVRPEVTKADSTIDRYSQEKRMCYFPSEYKLKFFKYYSVSNCMEECLAEHVRRDIGCVHYYMPRNDSTPLCNANQFDDVNKKLSSLYDDGLKKHCSHCWPPCTEITYEQDTTTTPLHQARLKPCEDWNGTVETWEGKNVTIVHIYMGQDSLYARVRKELYGSTDLLANTGGLMGLFLGFSGLSLIEILYFITLRAWCKRRRKETVFSKVAAKFQHLWLKLKQQKKFNANQIDPYADEKDGRYPRNSHSSVYQSNLKHRNYFIQSEISRSQNNIRKMDKSLPSYNSVIEEVNPFYTQQYWNVTGIEKKFHPS